MNRPAGESSGRGRSSTGQLPVEVGPGYTTLVGERGHRVVRQIVEYTLGIRPEPELGDACERMPDGTLLLHVDRATFDALELER